MAIESIHFVAGRVLEISRTEESYGSPVTVTIAGPEGELGSFPHRVQLFNSQRASEFLRSDVKVSDTILAEVSHMRFVKRHGDPGGYHFLSHLAQGGVLEKAQGYPDSSRHYLRAVYTGSAHSPEGGLEVQLREKRDEPDVLNDFVFVIGGRALRSFRKARLVRGEEILVRTSEVRPARLDPSGDREFTGTGFKFFRLGFGTPRHGESLGRRRRPAACRSSLAEPLPSDGPAVAMPTDGYEVAEPANGYALSVSSGICPTTGHTSVLAAAMPTNGYATAMPTNGYAVSIPADIRAEGDDTDVLPAAAPMNCLAVSVPADIREEGWQASARATETPMDGAAASAETPTPVSGFPVPDRPEPDGRENGAALPAHPRPAWRFQPRFSG